MKSSYSVAAIIPTYNSADFIRKTILSALEQNYEPFEIIVVDDGSTDDTVRVVESFSPQLKMLHHPCQSRLGPSASRNLGIRSTKADLIAFLDHDDIWYPAKIREQVKIFDNYPNVGLAHVNGYTIDKNDNILYELLPKDFSEPHKPEAILLNCYIKSPSSVMVRRILLEKTGMFDTGIRSGSDHDLWIRMKEITDFYFLPKHLLGYRQHNNDQMSRQRGMWEGGFDILERATSRYPYGLGVKRKRRAVLHYRLGVWGLKRENYRAAFKNLLSAFILDPYRSIKVLFSKAIKSVQHFGGIEIERKLRRDKSIH